MKNDFAEFSIEPLASCRKSCQRTANFINERRHNPYRVNPTSYNKPISAVVVDLHTSVSRLRMALENAIPSGFSEAAMVHQTADQYRRGRLRDPGLLSAPMGTKMDGDSYLSDIQCIWSVMIRNILGADLHSSA